MLFATALKGLYNRVGVWLDSVGTIVDEDLLRKLTQKAPHMMADVDDTSKALLALRLLDRPSADPQQLISTFESERCFKTYSAERNPSFTSNCNVLNALLCQEEPNKYIASISKTISFLIECWMNGPVRDKWVFL